VTSSLISLISILQDYYPVDEETASILRFYNQEVLLWYRLQFGESQASRHYFRKEEKKKVIPTENETEPLLDLLCGCTLGASIRVLSADLWPPSCRNHDGQLLEHSTYSTGSLLSNVHRLVTNRL
jgi:hypothetical protein